MCYDEGTLQAYLDRELPGRKRWEIEAHIATCNGCKQSSGRIPEDISREKIETININQKDLQEMRKVGHGGGEVNIENFGKFETSEFKPSEPISFRGAKDVVDFDLALPESVAGYGSAQLTIQYGFSSSFTLDVMCIGFTRHRPS